MKYTEGARTMNRGEWVKCVAAVRHMSYEAAEIEVQRLIDSGALKEAK